MSSNEEVGSSSSEYEHLPLNALRRNSGGTFEPLSLNNVADPYPTLPEESREMQEHSLSEAEELSSFLRKAIKLPSNWKRRLALNALPLMKWLPNYKPREYLFADILAGLTCGILAVPQGLAYAQLANLPPNYGLFSACFPPVVYFFFGSSPHLIVGPTAVMSMLVGSLNLNPQSIFLASFLVGLIQLLAGILQVGFFANLLSHAVIVGFTTAAAIIIICSQLKYIFNAPIPTTSLWAGLEGLTQVLRSGEAQWWCFLLSTMAIVFLLTLRVVKRVPRWFPGALVMVLTGTLLSYLLDLQSYGISNVQPFSGGLIAPHSFSFENTFQILPSCFLMALIGFIEAVSVGKTFAIQHNYDLGANEELYGLGWCNIVGAFFSSFPSTGSFARTAVNANTGGKTGLSNLISAIFVMLVMLFATPLFEYLPNGILGAVVVVAAVGLVDTASITFMWKSKKSDFLIALCSFALTIGLGIEMGIGSAFALSIAFSVLQSVRPPEQVIFFPSTTPPARRAEILESSPSAIPIHESLFVWRMYDSLYFANKSFCKARITDLLSPSGSELSTSGGLAEYSVRFFVIDAVSMNAIDTDGLHALHELCTHLKKRRTTLLIARLGREPYKTIQRAGLIADIGKDHFFREIHEAIAFARQIEPSEAERAKIV